MARVAARSSTGHAKPCTPKVSCLQPAQQPQELQGASALRPEPSALHPAPCTLHPAPCTLPRVAHPPALKNLKPGSVGHGAVNAPASRTCAAPPPPEHGAPGALWRPCSSCVSKGPNMRYSGFPFPDSTHPIVKESCPTNSLLYLKHPLCLLAIATLEISPKGRLFPVFLNMDCS